VKPFTTSPSSFFLVAVLQLVRVALVGRSQSMARRFPFGRRRSGHVAALLAFSLSRREMTARFSRRRAMKTNILCRYRGPRRLFRSGDHTPFPAEEAAPPGGTGFRAT
jgi:hypothetical protein